MGYVINLREKRIEKIKKQIAQGKYQVSSKSVAEKMLKWIENNDKFSQEKKR